MILKRRDFNTATPCVVVVVSPVRTIIRPGAMSVGTASAKFATIPSHTTRLNQVPAMLPLSILQIADRRLQIDWSFESTINRQSNNQSAICNLKSAISKPLQVLDDRPLVRVQQRRAVHMTAVAIAGHRRVVTEQTAPVLFRHGRH